MIQSGETPTATAEEEGEEKEELRQSRCPLHLPRPRLGLEGGAPLSVVVVVPAAAAAAAMSSRGAEPAKEEEEEGLSHIQGLESNRCVLISSLLRENENGSSAP